MSELTKNRNINFDENTQKMTVVKKTIEIFDKGEIYNIYQNLKQQLQQLEKQWTQLQKTIENVKRDLKELEPIYNKIKEDLKNQK